MIHCSFGPSKDSVCSVPRQRESAKHHKLNLKTGNMFAFFAWKNILMINL